MSQLVLEAWDMNRRGSVRSAEAPAPTWDAAHDPLLEVRDLRVSFGNVRAVDGIGYTLDAGQALAIVGESGSGKTVSARALLGLLPSGGVVESGSALFQGRDLLAMPARELRSVRGNQVAMVFQNAMEALNPTVPLRRQLTEHLRWHGVCGRREAEERAVQALSDVDIPEPRRRLAMYPFQLSGGMRQRALIAMAMVTRPKLLIADEPTTAVDVTVRRQLVNLLCRLKESGTAIIMITHDLGVAKALCDDVLVMYAGRQAERGATAEVVGDPRHPYTAGLLRSSVEVGGADQPLRPIPGTPPDLADLPPGCPFQPRCEYAEERCGEPQPVLVPSPGREVACWRAEVRP